MHANINALTKCPKNVMLPSSFVQLIFCRHSFVQSTDVKTKYKTKTTIGRMSMFMFILQQKLNPVFSNLRTKNIIVAKFMNLD